MNTSLTLLILEETITPSGSLQPLIASLYVFELLSHTLYTIRLHFQVAPVHFNFIFPFFAYAYILCFHVCELVFQT